MIFKYKFLQFSIITFLFYSCSDNTHFKKYKSIKDNVLLEKDSVLFHFNISDTTVNYTIYMSMRHGPAYPFANFKYIMGYKSPSGKYWQTNHNSMLRSKDGKFLGSGLGDMWDIDFMVQQNLKFAETGDYQISIINNLGLAKTPNVAELGLIIEKLE